MTTKVLHISKFYPPYNGGIEDVCHTIVDILKSNPGFEQRIFCYNDKKETSIDEYEGVTVTRIGVRLSIASQPIATTSYYKRLEREIKDFNPDFIHLHLPNPLAGAILLPLIPKHCRLILHWHSDIVDQTTLYRVIKPVENKLLKRAYIIIATSPNYIEGSRQLQKVRNKIVVIPNVINKNKLALTAAVKENAEKIKKQFKNKPIILFVGRHVPYKGIDKLIEAMKYVTADCVALIGGSGPLTNELKQLASTDDRIRFIGRVPDEELPAYYHAASIFAFPSVTKNEAFGVALAEAMFCGTPAITFTINGSGVNWVNRNSETGIEIPELSAEKYGMAIEELLNKPEVLDKMSSNAVKRISDFFTPEVIADKVIKLYS